MMRPETQDKIIAALKLHPGATAKQIAPQLDWGSGITSARLGTLWAFGVVQREAIPKSQGGGARVEYRYWFKPRIAIEADRRVEAEHAL